MRMNRWFMSWMFNKGENNMSKILEKIKNDEFKRSELTIIRKNTLNKFNNGDNGAKDILDAIDLSKPTDEYILFMGFCPNADFNNRLDIEWKEKGICRFDWEESEIQLERFLQICAGDLVVLKLQNIHKQVMKLYGFGRVRRVAHDENNTRYLMMDWSKQNEIIEIPLMGATATVNIRQMKDIEKQMPEKFFNWANL